MREFLSKHGYRIYRCTQCGLAQTEFRKSYASFLKKFYGKGYFTGDPATSAYENYLDDKDLILRNMKKLLTLVKRYKTKGKLLDVGCATGYFVELALREGYDAYGCDPSSFAIAKARKLCGRIRVRQGTLKTIRYRPNSFDIITFLDVFEHLKNPSSDIKKAQKLLKDDGILLIATGDSGSLAARLMGRYWTFFNPPQHLFFFSKKNIRTFLEQHDFTILKTIRVGKWLKLSYVLHLANTAGEIPFTRFLYRLVQILGLGSLPLFIPLYDNMVVVAKKIKYF